MSTVGVYCTYTMIYVTTDTHFNHRKLEEFTGRPSNFEEQIHKWLVRLTSDDVLIHLGDICIGRDEDMHQRYIEPLVCKKWLVKGNHDKKSNHWYLSHGWDFVATFIADTYFGKKILFSHVPQPIGDYDLNIHGHFHNSDHRRREPELLAIYTDKHRLVALENTDLKPVILEHLLTS